MSTSQQMPMQTPQDLFVHELSDIHHAEQIIIQMLEEAQGLVQNPQLQEGLRRHAEQSRQHAQRLQQVFDQMGVQPHPIQCHAAEGLHQELQEAQQSQPSPEVLEGLVVGGACKTEHYEIAAYTGLVEKARAMGRTEAAQLLQQNLQEEQQMLQRVEQISRQLTQQLAASEQPMAHRPMSRLAIGRAPGRTRRTKK
jgi:ferritin-like metal-binding protein YciE